MGKLANRSPESKKIIGKEFSRPVVEHSEPKRIEDADHEHSVGRGRRSVLRLGVDSTDSGSMDAKELSDSNAFKELARRWLHVSDAEFSTFIDDFKAYREEAKEVSKSNDREQLAFLAHALADTLTAPLPHNEAAVDIK